MPTRLARVPPSRPPTDLKLGRIASAHRTCFLPHPLPYLNYISTFRDLGQGVIGPLCVSPLHKCTHRPDICTYSVHLNGRRLTIGKQPIVALTSSLLQFEMNIFIFCHCACSTTPWAIRLSTKCWSNPCSRSTSLVLAPNSRLFEELAAFAGVLLRRGAGRGIPSARKEPLDFDG